MRILVLNDDPGALGALANALTGDGYEVGSRFGSTVTIADVTAFHPELIILDADASAKFRGIEFMQLVWLTPALRGVRFLVTSTGSPRIHAMEGALQTKGIGVVYAPYDLAQVLDYVRTQVGLDAQ